MALRVTAAVDYATRAMIHLGCLPEGRMALRSEIADAQNIPNSFIAKILRNLVRARLLRSARGVHGGFALSRPADVINLRQIVEAIEGPLSIISCVPDSSGCSVSADCPACSVWQRVQGKIEDELESTSLEALVSTPRRNGRVEQPIDLKSDARPLKLVQFEAV
jgi:Rrf2 family iron-sulfur cluster assembly transcriptional regulator